MKVLVCDDDQFARDLMTAMLEPLASEVITAENGFRAIELIAKENIDPDIILMDVIMPGIDGYETVEKIKSIIVNKHVPIIFLTALSSEDTLTRCLDYGDDFISKPVSEEVLHAKIRAHDRFVKLYNELQTKNNELTYFYQNTAYEQEIVKDIFDSFMSRNYLDAENIRYHISPISTFNGDLFLASKSPVGSIYFLVADITGHGLPAAIGTMPVSHTFFSMTKKGILLGTIAEEMNRMVSEFMPASMMCAATIMELSSNGERLMVWSGGMPDAFILNKESELVDRIVSHHMPLGALEQNEFCPDVEVKILNPSDQVMIYTDGVIESNNDKNEMFGEERIVDIIKEKGDVFDNIISGVLKFTAGKEQEDDITLVQINALPVTMAELAPSVCQSEVFPMSMSFSLNHQELQNIEPVPQIRRMIEVVPGMEKHIDFISTILSEMYANSLEHGILKLDSKLKDDEDGFEDYYFERQKRLMSLDFAQLDIELKLDKGNANPNLEISILDSGEGFDYEKIKNSDDENSHGRGVELIRYFCENYEYSHEGRCLTIEYAIDDEKLNA